MTVRTVRHRERQVNRRMKHGVVAGLVMAAVWASSEAGCLSRPVEHTDPNLKTNFTVGRRRTRSSTRSTSSSTSTTRRRWATSRPTSRRPSPTSSTASSTRTASTPTARHDGRVDERDTARTRPTRRSSRRCTTCTSASSARRSARAAATRATATRDGARAVQQRPGAQRRPGAPPQPQPDLPGRQPHAVTEGVVADAPAADPFLDWFPTAPNMGKTPGAGAPRHRAGDRSSTTSPTSSAARASSGAASSRSSRAGTASSSSPTRTRASASSGNLGNATASWSGVDTTILQQRHDFLRPDSLVASSCSATRTTPRSTSARSAARRQLDGAALPRRRTAPSACASNPGIARVQVVRAGQQRQNDPQCKQNAARTRRSNDWGYDLNLRHVHMKAEVRRRRRSSRSSAT